VILVILLLLGSTTLGHELVVGGEVVSHHHACEPRVIEGIRVRHQPFFTPEDVALLSSSAHALVAILGTSAIVSSAPSDRTNCHGFTFDDGRSHIYFPAPYLKNCTRVDRDKAKPGDVVIYRDAKDHMVHSGRVLRVDDRGIWVHSYWGNLGDFEHLVDAVPQGQEYVVELPGKKQKVKTATYGKAEFWRCP
jgi:hypothetical protein